MILFKKIYIIILIFFYNFIYIRADNFSDNNILWLSEDKIRRWEIWFSDIPNIVISVINFTLYFASAISIIFIIIGAYKILFWSMEQDTNKWKSTIIMAITWFLIAISANIIIKLIIDNIA